MNFGFPGSGIQLFNVFVTDVDTAAKLNAFDMRDCTVVSPMSYLVIESIYLLSKTVFISMLCIVNPTLATVEMHEFHRWTHFAFFLGVACIATSSNDGCFIPVKIQGLPGLSHSSS